MLIQSVLCRYCRHPRLLNACAGLQMLFPGRTHALPNRASQSLRLDPDLDLRRPAPPGQKRDAHHEQAAAGFPRRSNHLRRRRFLAVQVAAVAELAVSPVVAGATGPAPAAADVALPHGCTLLDEGRGGLLHARAKRSRAGMCFTGYANSIFSGLGMLISLRRRALARFTSAR